jgi:hypothetical protein
MELSLETYKRLHTILGEPPEPYLLGKVCDCRLLKKLDNAFLNNLDKDYLNDFLLITDWKINTFYYGHIINEIKESTQHYKLSYDSFLLIWNAFNENHKELNGKNSKTFHNLRNKHINFFIEYLTRNINNWGENKSLPLLKDLYKYYFELNNNNIYYNARITADTLGCYILYNKNILPDTLKYLISLQNLASLDTYIITYELKLEIIKNPKKLVKIFEILENQNIDTEQLLQEIIKIKNYPAIKSMIEYYELNLNIEDIANILLFLHPHKEDCEEFLLNVKPIDNLKDGIRQFLSKNVFHTDFNLIINKVITRINYETLNNKLEIKSLNQISTQKI